MQRSANEAMECPGLDHPGQNKKERPKRIDNKMRRKESRRPGAEQAAAAAAPWTGSSGDKGGPDAPHWIIRGGSGTRSHRTQDSIVEGHVAGRRPGLDHPGQNKKERPQPQGPGKYGLPPE